MIPMHLVLQPIYYHQRYTGHTGLSVDCEVQIQVAEMLYGRPIEPTDPVIMVYRCETCHQHFCEGKRP